MGSPKSFKDLFVNKIKVPFEGGSKIFVPPAVHKTIDQEIQHEKTRKELIKFVNTQKCVVCGMQLDGPVNYEYAELYCVYNSSHYKCKFIPGFQLPTESMAVYNFTSEGYQVENDRLDGFNFKNTVYKLDLNLIEKFRYRDKKLLVSYGGAFLKFKKNLSEQEFVQKLKIYMVFS